MATRRSIRVCRCSIEDRVALAEQGPSQYTHAAFISIFPMRSRRPCRFRRGRGARKRGWGLQLCAHCRCTRSRAAARVGASALRPLSFCSLGARQRGWGLQLCAHCRFTRAAGLACPAAPPALVTPRARSLASEPRAAGARSCGAHARAGGPHENVCPFRSRSRPTPSRPSPRPCA